MTITATDLFAGGGGAQGFPDSYQRVGNKTQVQRQIGNAVPVGIARWLGERAGAAMGGES